MEINVSIEIRDSKLVSDLFETNVSAGQKKEIADGVSIQLKSRFARDVFDLPTLLNIVADISEHVALPVAVGFLSRYIYDKLKDRRTSKVTINYIPIEINVEKIEKLVLEILENKKKSSD